MHSLGPFCGCLPTLSAWRRSRSGPSDLRHYCSHPAIPCFADPLLARDPAAVVGRTHQTGCRCHFTPVAKAPPAKELHHQEPRARGPDRAQAHQPQHPLLTGRARLTQPLATFRLKLRDLAVHDHQALRLAFKLALQLRRQCATVPQGERLEPRADRAVDLRSHAVDHQQRLNSTAVREPLALQPRKLAVQAPGIGHSFLQLHQLPRWHRHLPAPRPVAKDHLSSRIAKIQCQVQYWRICITFYPMG